MVDLYPFRTMEVVFLGISKTLQVPKLDFVNNDVIKIFKLNWRISKIQLTLQVYLPYPLKIPNSAKWSWFVNALYDPGEKVL